MSLMSDSRYHYTESGLDNVYLSSGFNIIESDVYGEGVSFNNMDGLHAVLTMLVSLKAAKLTAKEVKFLRTEANMSQKQLGAFLGVEDQTVSLWERGKQPIAKCYDLLLRMRAMKGNEMSVPVAFLEDRMENVDFDEDAWCHDLVWREQTEEHWQANDKVA